MKKQILFAALALCLSGVAYADCGGGNGNDDTPSNGCGGSGNGGAGGDGGSGTGIGIGVGVGTGGSAVSTSTNTNANENTNANLNWNELRNTSTNTNTNSVNSANTNVAAGGSASATGGNSTSGASSSSGGNSQSVNFNEAENPDDITVRQAPTVMVSAPYATASCYKTAAGGISGILGGLSVSGGAVDANCEHRELARVSAAIDQKAGFRVLCLSEAFQLANRDVCAGVPLLYLLSNKERGRIVKPAVK